MTLSCNGLFIRAKKAHVVSKRLDDFRERIQPQLGKVHDPIAETLNVDENHTFGVMVKADDFSESGTVPNTQLFFFYGEENVIMIAHFLGVSGNFLVLKPQRYFWQTVNDCYCICLYRK